MTPDQTRDNEMLPVVLPKHMEMVPAADGRHAVEFSDYHHWLPSEPTPDDSPGAAVPPAGGGTDRVS